MVKRLPPTLLLLLTFSGCAHPHPTPPPSQIDTNIERALNLLEAGTLHLDQPVSEVIQRTHPLHVYQSSPYTFIEYDDVPNLAGLSLIARNEKLASATHWTCTQRKQFFNNLTPSQQQAALDLYEKKVISQTSNQR